MPAGVASAGWHTAIRDDGGHRKLVTTAESHQRRPLVLLRPVPRHSAIHDLWAGTKLITALAISLLLVSYPGWGPIGLTAALLIVAARLAHIPWGALPTVVRTSRTCGANRS